MQIVLGLFHVRVCIAADEIGQLAALRLKQVHLAYEFFICAYLQPTPTPTPIPTPTPNSTPDPTPNP